jgi:type I restriction-modification system DNA methylase subunit
MAAEQKTKIRTTTLEHRKHPGKMDADDFRDYILGFIFYKYLSTKWICMLTPYKTRLDLSRSHRTC